MLSFLKLLDYLSSFPDSVFHDSEFKLLIQKGMNPRNRQEREVINEEIVLLIKNEINKRFNKEDANNYCQYVETIKNHCNIIAQIASKCKQ